MFKFNTNFLFLEYFYNLLDVDGIAITDASNMLSYVTLYRQHKWVSATQCSVLYSVSVTHKPAACWEIQVEHGSLVEKGWNECALLRWDFSLLITKEITATPKGEPR